MESVLELTGQQAAARDAVCRWLGAPGDQQVFRLFGYAGTGKTTIAKILAEQANRSVVFCAPTGKAAEVLSRKGCPARTIHSLIYQPQPKPRHRYDALRADVDRMRAQGASPADLRRREAEMRAEAAKVKTPGFVLSGSDAMSSAGLVVLDEASMVGGRLADDLLSFGVPILALGDPAQLPPVRGGGLFTSGRPDFLLTEVQRQSAGSPIIDLATEVRQGRKPVVGTDMGEVRTVRRGGTSMSDLVDFGQVIVGKNATRHALNRQIRRHLGRTGDLPVPGDRVVCRKNNADLGLLNGSQWIVHEAVEEGEDVVLEMSPAEGGNETIAVWADGCLFRDPDHVPHPYSESQPFDFAYAITCHTSQGSQWDSVFVLDESRVFGPNWSKWLYTAVTRACTKLTVSI